MKTLFITVLLSLIVAGVVTYFTLPGSSKTPIISWVIRADPVRETQIETFHRWLEENDYPAMELRLDIMSRTKQDEKNIIQGVSGVAGDVLDCYTGQVNLYQSVGMLEDLTDMAKELGFEASRTYPAIQEAMMVDGRQYGFPRNVGIRFYWANLETFERAGLAAPPDAWSFEEFERIGREFVQALNEPGEYQDVFFIRPLSVWDRVIFMRSLGIDLFNETMTRSNMDHPIHQKVFQMYYRWVNELKIIPTKMEAEGLSSSSGGGSRVEVFLFRAGNFGLLAMGRWGLMHFRKVGPKKLAVCELPNGGFRNTFISYGAGVIYKGSPNKDLAGYLLKFYASDVYNNQIVENADALPPIPAYTEKETFLNPPDYPNEWGLHGRIREMTMDLGIAETYCPFVLLKPVSRYDLDATNKILADRASISEALELAAEFIEKDIQRKIQENEKLRLLYEKSIKDQAEIERLRNVGKLVPLELISNPFYRRYYVEMGWSLPEGGNES